MVRQLIYLLILLPSSGFANSFNLSTVSSEVWYQAVLKDEYRPAQIFKNRDGSLYLKLNPEILRDSNKVYRMEILEKRDETVRFFSFGEINNLVSSARPMPNGLCLKCHLSGDASLLFSDKYLERWSAEPRNIILFEAGGRIVFKGIK